MNKLQEVEMTPTDTLRHEHEIILLVLTGVEREANAMDNGIFHPERIEQMLDFFRNFVDRCHHAKEEKPLLEKMQARGMPPTTGPIPFILKEHEEGRHLVATITAALAKARKDASHEVLMVLKDGLLRYVALLRVHINKENRIFLPMIDQLLEEKDQAALASDFDRIEREEMGEGVHEKYHQLAHELEAQ